MKLSTREPFTLGLTLLLGWLLLHPAGAETFSKADADRALATLQKYDHGSDPAPLRTLESMVRFSLNDQEFQNHLEEQIARFLQAEASLPAKLFLCQQLWVIGSDLSLPTLQKLLADPKTTEIACYALRSNPALQAGEVLRQAIPQATDENKIRLVNILGERREEPSLPLLLDLIGSPSTDLARSAAVALGKIGGDQAAQALAKARQTGSPPLKLTATQAYLQCAETFAHRAQAAPARSIYRELIQSRESNLTRRAALLGFIRLGGRPALNQLIAILEGDDPWLKTTAIAESHRLPGPRATKRLAAALPQLNPSEQVLMIAALAKRDDPTIREVIAPLTDNRESKVAAAALDALGTIGDTRSVDLLLAALGRSQSPETTAAAVRALRQIQGSGVEPALVAALRTFPAPGRPTLIQVLSDRHVQSAVPALLDQARDPSPQVRQAAYNALGKLAEPNELPALLQTLLGQPDDTALQEAERAAVILANKLENPQHRADPVVAALQNEKQEARKCSLLRILGGLGTEPARTAIQQTLSDPSGQVQLTAVRELSAWPQPQALPALGELWQDPNRDKTQRVLAFRGYLRLLGTPSDRPADQTLALFEKARSFAVEPGDKKLLLSSLSKLAAPGALQMAASYLEENGVVEEAALATVTIARQLAQGNPQTDLGPALDKVRAVSQNADLRRQAEQILEKKR